MARDLLGFGLPQKTAPAQNPRQRIEALASQHRVPANVLLALAEAGANVDEEAPRLGQTLASGKTLDQALAERDPARGAALLNRAYDIADELYPRQPAAPDPASEPGMLRQAATTAAGALVSGTGMGVDFAGQTLASGLRQPGIAGAAEAVAGPIKSVGRGLSDMAPSMQQAAQKSLPKGDWLKPWTLEAPEDFTFEGLVGIAAQGIGSMAPAVLASVLSRNPAAAGAIVGGAMGGGAAREQAAAEIDARWNERDANGISRLEVESDVFRDLVAKGVPREQAYVEVRDRSMTVAGNAAAAVAGLGGAATAKILGGVAGGSTRVARGLRGAAASGLEEGLQETAEGVATRAGVNYGAGTGMGITEGSAANFMAGAVGGAPFGALAAVSPDPTQPQNPGADGSRAGVEGAAPVAPMGAGAAADQGGNVRNPDIAPFAPPTGPATRAAALAPDLTPPPEPEEPVQRFPDQKPGAQIRLADPEGKVWEATFLREGPDGVVFRIAGEELTLPDAEFDEALTMARAADAEAKAKATGKPAQTAPVENVAKRPPVPEGGLASQAQAMIQPPARGAQDAQAQPQTAAQAPAMAADPGPGAGTLGTVGAPVESGGQGADQPALEGVIPSVPRPAGGPVPEDAAADAAQPVAPLELTDPPTPERAPRAVKPAVDVSESPTDAQQPGLPSAEVAQQAAAAPDPITAAAEETNPDPTPAQVEAENYKTGKADWKGLKLSIENKKGSTRRKVTPDGKTAWEVVMPAHYGRILRTEGADGDHVDFYMGDAIDSESVWIIDQIDLETKGFDEHKVMLGTSTAAEARAIYEAGFSDGKGAQRIGGIRKMTADQFKDWLKNGDTKKPVAMKAAEPARPGEMVVTNLRTGQKSEMFIDPLGPLYPGYERVMVNGQGTTDQTRMTEDGFVVLRQVNKTFIRDPQGKNFWSGKYDARESEVNAAIDNRRTAIKAEPPKPQAPSAAPTGPRVIINVVGKDGKTDAERGGPLPQDWQETPDVEELPMPKGFSLGSIVKMDATMAARSAGDPDASGGNWVKGDFKSVISRQSPYSVVGGYGKTRVDAINDAIRRAQRAMDAAKPKPEPAFIATTENFPFSDSEAGNPGAKARRWLEAASDATILAAPNMGLSNNWLRAERERRKIGDYAEKPPEPKPKTGWQPIGTNARGKPLFEDERGVRSYTENGIRITETVGMAPTREGGMQISINKNDRGRDHSTQAEWDAKNPAAPPPSSPSSPPPTTGILSSLSDEKQARAAELKAKLAAKARTQTSSGLDPEYITLGGELVALYIEAGTKRFAQMLKDFAETTGLTMRQAQEPMRAAYNHVRDTMDLAGEDVSDMDDAKAVLAEVRRVLVAETSQKPKEDAISEPAQPGGPDEQRGNQEGDQDQPAGQSPGSGVDGDGQPDGQSNDDGRGEGDENGAGDPAGDDPAGSVGDDPGSVSDGPVEARKGTPAPNFIIADDFPLGEGTEGQKLAANMAALRLVRALESENRFATPEEQAVLARWVGWGGLKTVFDGKHDGTVTQWGRAQAELRTLLSPQEYVAAMRSTNDAHYTSRTVVKAMWRAMRNFGFEGGRALEPTIGSGNFLGLQPADLSENTEWYASELDPLTGLIVKHLYPKARVFDGMGFQDAPFRRATFDVAIGNPPFGSTKIGNKNLHPDLGKMSVHNFIIAKTGQLLREGGVMSMVVTHRFLDTPNPEARAALAPEFRFLGAIRLPNTAFQANANTDVTTDIVFFQKRRQGETDNDTTWLETGKAGPNDTRLNGYFAANPDMILGRAAMDGTMYAGGRKKDGKGEFTVHADGRDLEAALNEAIDRIEATIPDRETALEDATTASQNSSTLHYGAMMLAKDGKIYRGEEDTAGNRVVEEVTAESFWRDNAEAQSTVVTALRAVLAAKTSQDLTEQLNEQQRARDAALEVGLIDLAGDPVKHETKYEQALADSFSNLIFANRPRTEAIEALNEYEKAVDRKRLGTDGFQRLAAMLDLRQKTRELIAMERADAAEGKIEAKRRVLRRTYRLFKNRYGYLNNSKNEAILRGDVGPELALELSYKAANKEGRAESAKEAAILEKRVIFPHKLPESVESVSDGLHVSMQERGYIDPVLIGQLTGKTTEAVVAEMTSGEDPLAFRNPKVGHYEIAEVYLSGNLAEKIKAAENAGVYQNVPHLKKAMPPPKTQDQITPSIRSLWIPPSVFTDFLRTMGYSAPSVSLLESVGMASVEPGDTSGLTEFGAQFQTERMNPGRIFEHAIKGKIPVIYDSVRTPEGGFRQVKNEEATREAVVAYERMSREFPQWAYANPERAGKIVDAFNEKMNVVTERKYQGVRYLRMVGNSPEIDLRNSQKNGAWRMIQDKVTLLHHVVGAGKTFTAIAGIMERKRMGLTRKAVVAVPNHLTGQWGREWLELYPAANILVPTEKDFEPANRAKLINRIATGDFDAVIIGHSQLTKIENDPVATQKYISEQIDELNEALQAEKRSGESKRTVGQIGTRLTKLTEKLGALQAKLDEKADARLIGWQDLGVDYLAVDEAHLFKNLEYTTTATQLVGMNPSGGSQRAFDMLMKVRTLQAMQGGGVAFLTGTPVSNSLVEIYSMMKYLIPESLQSMGISSFDAWKAAFIQDESRFEYTASMQLKERNIMSGMINLGPLSQLYRSFSDIVMRPDVERMFTEQMEARNAAEPDPAKQVSTRFPTPKVKGGSRRISLAPPTERMKEFVRYLVMRMAGIKENKSNKAYMSVDNALWVLTDARKASVDIRTIDPTLGREEGSKVDRSSAEVFRIWQKNTERRGTQMVFSDMSAPTKAAVKDANRVLKAAYEKIGMKKDALKARMATDAAKTYAERWGGVIEDIENLISSPDTDDAKRDRLNEFIESEAAQDAAASMFTADTGFSFYDDMKAALIEKGIPEKEIAFIHDYDTTVKKAQLFEAVNEGRVRVLIGSTQKMGAGTNAQKRLVALHHIDAPWRPSDMEQREGRIIRQGNLFYEQDPEGFEVEIIAYSTEQTADVVQWQVLERKASSIETFMDAAADNLVEEGGDADQYAEFMAQSTGKQVFLQKMQAEKTRDTERALIAASIRGAAEADSFLSNYDRSLSLYTDREKTFKGFSMATIGDGAETYLSDWESTVAAYREEKARVEAEANAIRKENAGLPKKEHRKLPDMPEAPERWSRPPAKGWERKVYDTLKSLESQFGKREAEIALGDGFYVTIKAQSSGVGGVVSYRAYLVPPRNNTLHAEVNLGGWADIEVKDFRRSDKLLQALSPANIAMQARERADRHEQTRLRHIETLPQMQAIKDRGVDMSGVNRAEEDLARLSALVRVEEVKFASATVEAGANHFAARDNMGRALIADATAQAMTDRVVLKNAGQTYVSEWGAPYGTRRVEGTDRSGTVMLFESENESTGEKVLIEAIRPATLQEGESDAWAVLNVWDNPSEAEETAPVEASPPAPRRKKTFEMRLEDDGGPATMESRQDAPRGWGEIEADPPITDAQIITINRALNAEMRKSALAGKVPVAVVREIFRRTLFGMERRPNSMGSFGPKGIQVRAGAAAGELGVLRHEIIHALRSPHVWSKPYGLFAEGEWQALVKAARADTAMMENIKGRYPDLTVAQQMEEMVAELYRNWADRQDQKGTVQRAFERIRGFFQGLARALRGEGFTDAAMVMERIASGEVGRRGGRPEVPFLPDGAEMRADPLDALKRTMLPAGKKRWRWAEASYWSDLLTDAMAGRDSGRYSVLGLVPGRALFGELGKNLMAAKAYLRGKEQMDALRNAWHVRADKVAQEWRTARNKDPRANEALMDLMHDTTLDGLDPSKPDLWRHALGKAAEMAISREGDAAPLWAHDVMAQIRSRKASYDRLVKRFNALPPAMQAIYRKVRNEYDTLGEVFERTVIENVETATRIAIKRAERAYRKEMARIRDEGLEGAEKEAAEAEAEAKWAGMRARGGWGAKARIAQLRQSFESNRLTGPYFPLARFGDFFVTVRDEQGAVTSFSRFESKREQREWAAEAEKEAPGRVTTGVMSNKEELKGPGDPNFTADVQSILQESGASAEVMDAVWQRWLESLPDRSIRTNRIHRKGRQGYSRDAFRAFGKQMFHGAHQLARLKYGLTLEEHLNDAEEEARRAPDPERAGLVVNEMRRRHAFAMNPQGSAILASASSLAFVWYLGLSPAAAAVNIFQTTTLAPAIFAARFQEAGFRGAAQALTQAAIDFGRGKGDTAASNRLTADEKAAMAEALDRGVIDKTQAHDLASVADTGIEYNATRERVMRAIGWMFHHTERFNREVTFLAGYRLGRKSGLSAEDAINAAADMTYTVHFDYQNTARARFMQGDIGRALTMFRQHIVNMLWRMFRDAHQMFAGATKEERREARVQLVGITLSMMAHAGIKGTWGYALVMMLLAMFLPGDSDDLEDALQDALLIEGDTLGVAAWNWTMGAALNGVPGQVTGLDLTNRIGMPTMWFRGSDRDLEGEDLYAHYVGELLGPVYGIGEGTVRGTGMILDGEWQRGVETVVPKWARDILKAGRYATEGAETMKGDPIMESVSPWQVVAQMNGFTSAQLAERYKINNRLKNKEAEIMKRRQGIHRAIGDAVMAGEPIPQSAMDDLRAFNKEYPEYPITRKTIDLSIKGRQRASARNEFGVQINPRLNARLRGDQPQAVYQ